MPTATDDSIEIRGLEADDEPAVLDLLAASLGWMPDDLHARFFAWKHRENSFGKSPAWVAVDTATEGRIAGLRIFLRWEFERDNSVRRAVRAVDTATHPDYRGRGIFSALTLRAVEAMRAEGVDWVFNTPNEQSRPGYLKMGWQQVGRLPVQVRPRLPFGPLRMARARVPAEKWSLPSDAGRSAAETFADRDAVASLLASAPAGSGVHTRRTPEHLRWRYGFEPLAYRAVLAGTTSADGAVVFRLRRRGTATEATVCEVLVPGGDARVASRLLRRVVDESGADYAIALRHGRPWLGFVPLPRQGPVLTWRDVTDTHMPALGEWRLSLGDVELF